MKICIQNIFFKIMISLCKSILLFVILFILVYLLINKKNKYLSYKLD